MTGDDWGVATGHKWRLGGGGVELERGCNLEKKGGGRHTHSTREFWPQAKFCGLWPKCERGFKKLDTTDRQTCSVLVSGSDYVIVTYIN